MRSNLVDLNPTSYSPRECVVFKKTKERYGGLSNMAAGYPVRIGEVGIRTSEALYQACRFPHASDVQEKILSQTSPMAAKMVSKPYRRERSRQDWDKINIEVMWWCLRVKLVQNWRSFGTLLQETDEKSIVEESRRDSFWGAVPQGETLRGMNVLGKLLVKLRDEYRSSTEPFDVDPPEIESFLLLGEPISLISSTSHNNGEQLNQLRLL